MVLVENMFKNMKSKICLIGSKKGKPNQNTEMVFKLYGPCIKPIHLTNRLDQSTTHLS